MSILMKNGMIIDSVHDAPICGKSILISDGIITKIAENIPEDAADQVIDCSGQVIMPGMIDCHIHIYLDPIEDMNQSLLDDTSVMFVIKAINRLKNYLPAGFTTIRINGGVEHLATSLRDAVAQKRLSGPRIVAAGQYLSITGGHGTFFSPWVKVGNHMCRYVDGPEEIRKAVREQIWNNVDVIKFFSSGGALDPNSNLQAQEFTDEELQMFVREAKRGFRRTSTHAHGTVSIKSALRAGVDSIEHASMLDEECIALLKETGSYIVPTLKASAAIMEHSDQLPDYVIRKAGELVRNVRKSFQMAYQAGVNIAMGTDSGTPFNYHGENAKELELMTAYGMSNMDAIKCATIQSARNLALGDVTGSIEEGKCADLLLIDGDPLQDITILQKKECISIVMKEGIIEIDRRGKAAC